MDVPRVPMDAPKEPMEGPSVPMDAPRATLHGCLRQQMFLLAGVSRDHVATGRNSSFRCTWDEHLAIIIMYTLAVA